jgi:hypothetical protein
LVSETEHAVWTLVVAKSAQAGDVHERIAEVVDAGGWLAGVREHYCGVIEEGNEARLGDSLKERYGRSSASIQLHRLREDRQVRVSRALAALGGRIWRRFWAIASKRTICLLSSARWRGTLWCGCKVWGLKPAVEPPTKHLKAGTGRLIAPRYAEF